MCNSRTHRRTHTATARGAAHSRRSQTVRRSIDSAYVAHGTKKKPRIIAALANPGKVVLQAIATQACLPCCHPNRAIEPNCAAVKHRIFDDLLHELRVFLWAAKPLWERRLTGQ